MTRRSARLQDKSKAAPPPKAGKKRKATTRVTESKQSRKRAKKSSGADDNSIEDVENTPKKIPLLHRLMTEVPEDIAIEIFAYLEPSDILTLTRCSPELYNKLHSAASLHIWRNARRNVEGLPPPPPDMNEIQYAILAFDAACHACGRTNCQNVFWDCRFRSCKKCRDEMIISEDELKYRYGTASQAMLIGLEKFSSFSNFFPNTKYSVSGYLNATWMTGSFEGFSALDFDQIFFEYQAAVAGDESRFKEWVKAKKRERQRRLKHVRLCEEWHQQYVDRLAEEKEEIRMQRREDIENRLIALGFESEVEHASDPYSDFSTHRLVRQAVKLTDQEWEKIASILIGMMEAERERRGRELYQEHLQKRYFTLKQTYQKYFKTHNLAEIGYPPLGDVIQSKVLDSIIWKSPLEDPVSEDDFLSAFAEKIPGFAEKWRKQKEGELRRLVKERAPDVSIENMELASVVFVCRMQSCRGKLLWYPAVLSHECLCSRPYEPRKPPLYFDPYKEFSISPWDKSSTTTFPSLLLYSTPASRIIQGLVEACGSSPDTTTLRQLDDLNPIVDCKTCKWASQDMTWTQALKHAAASHHGTDCIVTSSSVSSSRPNKDNTFELRVRSFAASGKDKDSTNTLQEGPSKPDVGKSENMDLD